MNLDAAAAAAAAAAAGSQPPFSAKSGQRTLAALFRKKQKWKTKGSRVMMTTVQWSS